MWLDSVFHFLTYRSISGKEMAGSSSKTNTIFKEEKNSKHILWNHIFTRVKSLEHRGREAMYLERQRHRYGYRMLQKKRKDRNEKNVLRVPFSAKRENYHNGFLLFWSQIFWTNQKVVCASSQTIIQWYNKSYMQFRWLCAR